MRKKQERKGLLFAGITGVLVLLILIALWLLFQVLSMKKELKPQMEALKAVQTTDVAEREEIEIYLPEIYYAVTDLTMDIYNSQITSKCSFITEYNVKWTCDIGESLKRKYSITATEDMIGDHELTVGVYDNALNLIAEKSCTLRVVKRGLQKGFSILQIGDSLSCDGMLYRRLQGMAEDQLIFNGTQEIEGFLMEGRYAFSAEDYLNPTPYYTGKQEDCHPFYNPETETFDWDYYRENTGFYPEVVQIFLGTNNIRAGEENADHIVAIVDAIREDDVMTPIYVVNTIFQGSQNGLGSWKTKHGEYLSRGLNKHEQDLAVFELMVHLAEKLGDYEGVYLVPAGISMDSEYNYQSTAQTVNPYSLMTETYETDPIHPDKAGYYQIADVMFATFCGTRNE